MAAKVTYKQDMSIDRVVELTAGQPTKAWTSSGFVVLEADGEELDYILRRFTNIPQISVGADRPTVMQWFGDHANFVIAKCS